MNYSSHSLKDLRNSAKQIDENKFEEEYAAILAAIKKKKENILSYDINKLYKLVGLLEIIVAILCLFSLVIGLGMGAVGIPEFLKFLAIILEMAAGFALLNRNNWGITLTGFIQIPTTFIFEIEEVFRWNLDFGLSLSSSLGYSPISLGINFLQLIVFLPWIYLIKKKHEQDSVIKMGDKKF